MKLSDIEKIDVQNLLKLIRRSSFKDLQGLEALALARAYHWLENLLKEPIPPTAPPMASPTVPPVLQVLPSPIIESVKKSKKKSNG